MGCNCDEGSSTDCTLLMQRDQSVTERGGRVDVEMLAERAGGNGWALLWSGLTVGICVKISGRGASSSIGKAGDMSESRVPRVVGGNKEDKANGTDMTGNWISSSSDDSSR